MLEVGHREPVECLATHRFDLWPGPQGQQDKTIRQEGIAEASAIPLERAYYNLFNRNCNFSHRLQEWQELQDEQEPLLDLATDLALEQHRQGRFFILENPQRAEVWNKPQIEKLRQLPGVWDIVVDAGAYGATNTSGEPIQKPFRFIGNMPGMDETLQRRLSPHEKALCIPVEGRHTRASQEYPEELCRTILKLLKEYVRNQEPH